MQSSLDNLKTHTDRGRHSGSHEPRLRRRLNRTGSTYFLVVSVAMIVSVISIGSLAIQSSLRRKSQLEYEYAEAGLLAQSSIELMLEEIEFDELWRKNIEENSITGQWEIGSPKAICQATDPLDDNLTDDLDQIVKFQSIGDFRNSVRSFSLLGIANGHPLDVLRTACHSSSKLYVLDELTVGKGPVSCFDELNVSQGYLYGDAEMLSCEFNARVTGGKIFQAPQKQMPSRLLFDVYSTMATEIAFDDLPQTDRISDVYVNSQFSPSNQPSEFNNPHGIYRIDVPAGKTLTIENSNLSATLLIKLTGDNSKLVVDEGVIWHPHTRKYPSLIAYTDSDVGTTIDIKCAGTFIPTATPVGSETGSTDPIAAGSIATPGSLEVGDPVETDPGGSGSGSETGTTIFPVNNASLNGLFHVIRNTGNPSTLTRVTSPNRITGSIVCEGHLELYGQSFLVADQDLLSFPPLGYTGARPTGHMLANSDMNAGTKMWQPTLTNEWGAGTKLIWESTADPVLAVDQRQSAASGVFQDVTHWLQTGQTYNLTAKASLKDSAESMQFILEYETETDGLQRLVQTFYVNSTWTSISATFQPTFTGELKHARILIATTATNQTFLIDDVEILDGRTNKPSDVIVFPTTWQFEQAN